MAVPWTGFPMVDLMQEVGPLSSARYVRFTTFLNPAVAPGQFATPDWPWPYTESLTIEEASNDLTLLATGIYGHQLPKQHGAPLRLVVPWKYGYKSIKSIVGIEFTRERPDTFWNTAVPDEYEHEANVDPTVPHPRWSQSMEVMLGTLEERPTLLYNGYDTFVRNLY